MRKEELKKIIVELEENKEDLPDHIEKFIESVAEFYYEKGFVTEAQEEYLIKYHKQLQEIYDEDKE